MNRFECWMWRDSDEFNLHIHKISLGYHYLYNIMWMIVVSNKPERKCIIRLLCAVNEEKKCTMKEW